MLTFALYYYISPGEGEGEKGGESKKGRTGKKEEGGEGEEKRRITKTLPKAQRAQGTESIT